MRHTHSTHTHLEEDDGVPSSASDVNDLSGPHPIRKSQEGRALYKRFVRQNPNNADEITLNDRRQLWDRAKEVDNYAAELIRAHEGSLELEKRYDESEGRLEVGKKSKNGAVEHLGAGVFLEKDTPAIDRDSRRKDNSATITRLDLRDVANKALDEVDAMERVAVIGYPGTGKTRGGLTYALQSLLWRGEVVLRVGYKDNKVYAFLPNETGTYEVWSSDGDLWRKSEIARSSTAYALIDPPEDEPYTSIAPCKVLKFVSNGVKKHYRNFDKDGTVLITAMPTLEEVLAMTPVLWNEKTTPITSDDVFRGIDAKKEEIRDRCALVGCSLRHVFSGDAFIQAANAIYKRATNLALNADILTLPHLYFGSVTTFKDNRASSVNSRVYEVDPCSTSNRTEPRIRLKALAKYTLKKQGAQKTSQMDVRTAFMFEDLCATLMRGGSINSTRFPARNIQQTINKRDAIKRICNMREEGQSVVVAPKSFPMLDFATSLYVWLNAEVGDSKPEVHAGAFITLMLDLGLARKVNDKLVMNKEHKNAKITLTMLRSKPKRPISDDYVWNPKTTENHEDLDPDKLKKFFEKHVKVNVLDMSNWSDRESENRDKLMERLLDKYCLPTWDVPTL